MKTFCNPWWTKSQDPLRQAFSHSLTQQLLLVPKNSSTASRRSAWVWEIMFHFISVIFFRPSLSECIDSILNLVKMSSCMTHWNFFLGTFIFEVTSFLQAFDISSSLQVAAPPKKTKKEKGDPEVVVPKGPKEMAEDFMPDMLKSLNQAMSHAIKLTNVTYGKDLAKNLLDFAVGVEELYKSMQGALDKSDVPNLVALFHEAKKMRRKGKGRDLITFDLKTWSPLQFLNQMSPTWYYSPMAFTFHHYSPMAFTFHLHLRSCTSEGSSGGTSEEACKEKGWGKGKEGQESKEGKKVRETLLSIQALVLL